MGLVAGCQAVATVAFHTVTNNRILTPSIMGFESLYRVIHTSTIFFFGAVGLNNARTVEMFIVQLILMFFPPCLLSSCFLMDVPQIFTPMFSVALSSVVGLG